MTVSATKEIRKATHLRVAGRPRRVVIVADNLRIVEAISLGFRKSGEFNLLGYAYWHQPSARRVLAADPDVILLDDMGRSDQALELTRQLSDQNQQVAIIVLSVEMDPEWLRELFDAGATGVISKATDPIALATLVRETLDGHICLRHKPVRSAKKSARASVPQRLPLTTREIEILRLVASGSTNCDVARHLWVTEQTVKFHLRNIYRKLDVANRTQASRFAYLSGLVDESSGPGLDAQPALTAAS
jgi:DNA-binding NarL/FixJ family response regulator